jgi:hypothetical protein
LPDQLVDRTTEPTKSTSRKTCKALKVVGLTGAIFFGANVGVYAFSLGGLSGLLDTVAPVISQYTGMDITKYAGYLSTFESVAGAVQSRSFNSILGAAGDVGATLGEAGLIKPSSLAANVFQAVQANYSSRGKSLSGAGFERSADRALTYAQNQETRAYLESVFGEQGQKNIKEGVKGSGDLVKAAGDIAEKGAKSNVSQKKLDAIAGIGVVGVVGQSQIYNKLTEIHITNGQQLKVSALIAENLTKDRTSKFLGETGARSNRKTSGSVFAALAGPSQSTSSGASGETSTTASSPETSSTSTRYQQLYGDSSAEVSPQVSDFVPPNIANQ